MIPFLTKNDLKAIAVFGVVGLSSAFALGYLTEWRRSSCTIVAFLIAWAVEFWFRRTFLDEDPY